LPARQFIQEYHKFPYSIFLRVVGCNEAAFDSEQIGLEETPNSARIGARLFLESRQQAKKYTFPYK